MYMKKQNQGFTLIELLVVIGIVAILSVVVILTLNPAQLLKQARDSNRISDLATIRSGLSLYLADVSSPTLASSSFGYTHCYSTSGLPATSACTSAAFATSTGLGANATSSLATSTAVNALGWIPVHFDLISSGAPMGSLPVDPVNNATNFYAYGAASTSLTFKVVASGMESTKYGFGTVGTDVVSTDGGNSTSSYEVGTNLAL